MKQRSGFGGLSFAVVGEVTGNITEMTGSTNFSSTTDRDQSGLKGKSTEILNDTKKIKKLLNDTNPELLTPELRKALVHKLNLTGTIDLSGRKERKKNVPKKQYKCECSNCDIKPTTCYSYRGCFSSVEHITGSEKKDVEHYGCLHEHHEKSSEDFRVAIYCGTNNVSSPVVNTHGNHLSHSCVTTRCCTTDLCNSVLPKISSKCIQPKGPSTPSNSDQTIVSIAAPVGVLILLVALLLGCFKIWKRKSFFKFNKKMTRQQDGTTLTAVPLSDDSLKCLLEHSCSSGSGAGVPFLVQRTVARQIVLCDLIGRGRYGEVRRGNWQGESVAVKIFNSRDEESWRRETEIYNTVLLRHDNILGYIAADIATKEDVTCMWLVTHYHSYGSLYDYLNENVIDVHQMCTLAFSSISGLTHLHTEITGLQGKPAIAHRDVKTKNILVKQNGECCISDFGLAVLHSSKSHGINISSNRRVGTKRYMAPEILDETLDRKNFDAFKNTDIYAFGLVLWEIATRTQYRDESPDDYQPPFYDKLCQDPPFEDVRRVVCEEKYRPHIPKSWKENEYMMALGKMMVECWHDSPKARLRGLRIKKSIGQLMQRSNQHKKSVGSIQFSTLGTDSGLTSEKDSLFSSNSSSRT